TGTGTGTVTFNSGSSVATSGQTTIFYNPTSYTSPTNYSTNVSGPLTAFMLVNTPANLQSVGDNVSGNYALGRDIDASNISNFVPIGQLPGSGFSHFTGIFDGQNHTISNLTIAPTGNGHNHIGLFAYNGGTIRDLTLTNVNVTANPNGSVGLGVNFQAIGTLA